jgi:hypothetical protein
MQPQQFLLEVVEVLLEEQIVLEEQAALEVVGLVKVQVDLPELQEQLTPEEVVEADTVVLLLVLEVAG